MLEIPTEWSVIYKESRRTSSIGNILTTIAKISIGIIGLLLRSNNKNAIVVIMDYFTKMTRLKINTMAVLSEEIAKIYQDDIWKMHRVPKKI